MSLPRRTLLLCGSAILAAGTLGGCSLGGNGLRQRFEEQFTRAGMSHDGWLSDSATEVTRLETPLFASWLVLHARNAAQQGDQRNLIAAIPAEGNGFFALTAEPDNWAEVVMAAGARIDVPASAAESARMMVLATNDFKGRQTMISSVDDMPWVDRGSADVTAVREEFGHDIRAPYAERDGKRWIATVWTTHEQDLMRHSVGIEPDLLHADIPEVWVGGLALQSDG
ncbi:MAG: hypothetical protein L0G99_10105 [Propionibacteriales bacterium]|nr:hypothetical protein [Propionibacteriales bacterium]